MPNRLRSTNPAVVAAAVALTEANVDTDILETLLVGTLNGTRAIAPGALACAVTAARVEVLEEVARWHDKQAEIYLSRRWAKKAATHQISAATVRAMKDDLSIG